MYPTRLGSLIWCRESTFGNKLNILKVIRLNIGVGVAGNPNSAQSPVSIAVGRANELNPSCSDVMTQSKLASLGLK